MFQTFIRHRPPVPRLVAVPALSVLLLSLAGPGTLRAAAESPAPPRIAILFQTSSAWLWPNAVPLLTERALDARGVRFEPVPLPPGAAGNLVSLIDAIGEGGPGDKERSFLRSEARTRRFDTVILVRSGIGPAGASLSLAAASEPFDGAIEIDARGETAPGSIEELAALVGRLVEATGWPAGEAEPFVHAAPSAEERYARALAVGAPALFREIMEADSTHEGARLHLAGRLALGEFPRRGRALLDSIEAEELPPLERALLPAWRAVAWHDRPALGEAADHLARRFPGRFETLLFRGILGSEDLEFDAAEQALRRAAEIRPLDPLPRRLIGEGALRRGFLDGAEVEFRAADNLGRGDPLARIGLASVYYSEGRLDEAEDILAAPPPPYPHRWTSLFLYEAARANLHVAEGLFAEAERELLRARDDAYRVGNEEAVVDLTVRLCHTYLEGGAADAAAGEAAELRFRSGTEAVKALPPGLVPYLEGLVGVEAQDFGTVSAKKLEISTITGSDPAWPPQLEGRYLLENGSGWEAIPYLREAARMDSSLVNRLHLARAYLASDRPESSRRILESVVESGESLLESPPTLPLAFYYLGRSLTALDDGALAKIAYREFLNYWHDPDSARPEWRHANSVLK